MKTRIISGIAVTLGMVLTLALSGIPFVLNGIIAAVAATALFELLRAGELHKNKGLTAGLTVFAAAFVFISDPAIPVYKEIRMIATFLLVFGIFAYYLKGYKTVPMPEIAFALAMTLLTSYFFSSIVLVRRSDNVLGFFYLLMICLLAWIPDTGAYFCGSAFGKHKLAPVISPKKTIEGAVGGLIICVGVTYLYAWLVSLLNGNVTEISVNYWAVVLYAVPGTLVSILGDLTASLIKRYYKIKDYGNLIPGHGGIMDRFDSIWFVAPFVWLMLQILPIFS